MTPSDWSARSELTQAPGSWWWQAGDRNRWLPIAHLLLLHSETFSEHPVDKGKCKPPGSCKQRGIWAATVTAMRSDRWKRAGNNQRWQRGECSTGNDAPPKSIISFASNSSWELCCYPQVSDQHPENWSKLPKETEWGAGHPDLLLYFPVQSLFHTTLPLLFWPLGWGF